MPTRRGDVDARHQGDMDHRRETLPTAQPQHGGTRKPLSIIEDLDAHALAAQAQALARAHQEQGHQAYALRLLGDIAAGRAPVASEQALAHYQQALALADALGMRPLQAHCHRGLGTLHAATGQREQARAALSTAIELYRAMEMTFWLPETEAALGQVEG
jgi:tetratricopeptide (TPR) repeat protein